MYTVSKLARRCGLSRSTLLYYERIGLLQRPSRSGGNYRRYGESDLRRLERICIYRGAGLRLEDIRAILERPDGGAPSILQRRLGELNAEIEALRAHQRAILQLLENDKLGSDEAMTKEKWVSIMRSSGFTDTDMERWHAVFERSAPGEHQEFLEFLRIPPQEIVAIREWSRAERK
jgi:DNA-binding transcriptional MerR regulator